MFVDAMGSRQRGDVMSMSDMGLVLVAYLLLA